MMQIILAVMAVIADIFTIVSVCGINGESPLWQKIILIIASVIISIGVVIMMYSAYDIKVKRYYYKEEENEFRVYTKKNKYLVDGSVVSIYYKYQKYEEKCDDLVALGCVIINEKSSDVQIRVFKMIDEKLFRNILSSNRNCKKYHVKPNVEFSRISDLIMDESEVNGNV